MNRVLRLSAIGLGILLVLSVAGWLWVGYALREAFSFSKTDVEPLETIVKAAMSDIVVIHQPEKVLSQGGYAELYEKDPGQVRATAKLSGTWVSAMSLAEDIFKSGPSGNWVRRSDELRLVNQARLDPWGHPFCLLRRENVLVVVSAGPKAQEPPICKNVHVVAEELERLPRGRLVETPGGALLLAVIEPQGLKPSLDRRP